MAFYSLSISLIYVAYRVVTICVSIYIIRKINNIIIAIVRRLVKTIDSFSPRNPIDSQTEAIQVLIKTTDGLLLTSALLGSGFRLTHSNQFENSLSPCPLGTFSNRSTKGTDGCTSCTPGK